ncbi:MAG: NAD-dependent epimerase/dehydratase family protein [Megasphaera sp.]|jgi:UDP-glucose 4-epimerase|nr:NAD-dependent epimerase/dehydratase family protein [Megasphaera sp.]MCI1247431.1 NAD-dependent epimerase/dehydratase family protein [Megasphaera sp.]
MRVLVTGGAGFIGSHLVPALLAAGHTVTVIDDLRHGLRSNVPDGARLVVMDIADPGLHEIMDHGAFDGVIHLAAQTRVDISIRQPVMDATANIMGTIHVLEECRQCGVRRIILASTAAAYGNPPLEVLPIRETYPLQPISFYGRSKVTAESYCRLYHRCFGMEYVVLRFANVYGERAEVDDEGGVIDIFAKRAAKDMPLSIYGDGSQSRDYIYVGDIAAGIIAALQTANANSSYNLSTETEVTLTEIVKRLAAIAGKTLTPAYVPVRQGDIYRSVLCNARARRDLSWQPVTSLDEGLSLTYRYFLKH